MRDMPSTTTFADLKRTGRLPSPKGVALRLMELAGREDSSVGEMTRVLHGDPALAGRVIKAANSAARGGGRAAVSIGDAVVRLGMRSVRQLAMSFSLIDQNRQGESRRFDFDAFWARSIATGTVADRLARHGKVIVPDEAFTLGLLLDIGELALATLYPVEFDRLADETSPGPEAPPAQRERERRSFGIDRDALTALMLEDWLIPQALVDGVRARDPEAAAGKPERLKRLGELLALADAVARHFVSKAPLTPQLREQLLEWVGAGSAGDGEPATELAALLEDIAREWREWCALLVVRGPMLNVADLLAEAASPVVAGGGPVSCLLVVAESDPLVPTLSAAVAVAGFGIAPEHDPAGALAAAGKVLPDVVLLDLDAPDVDGIAFCRELRALPGGAMPYVVVLVAARERKRLADAFAAGADDFLPKPFEAEELEARLRAAARIAELKARLTREAEALRSANAALEAANQRLGDMALTDSLTGLPNRRQLLERLRETWDLARAQAQEFAVIYVDLDHFKKVNDDRGHEAGDIVLERVGRVLRRNVRASDVVGRFGGEEFVVLCPGCDLQTATRLAERIRAQLALEEFSIGDSSWRVTASLGVSGAKPAAVADWRSVLRAADSALFEAKRRGRNRVCA
jgi:diguanylate cyclase (GGDEF)-like protein